jgi:hypothetical protein
MNKLWSSGERAMQYVDWYVCASGLEEVAAPICLIDMIWYDMIYLTAIGFTLSGSSTLHTNTQTIHRTTQSTQTIYRTTQTN